MIFALARHSGAGRNPVAMRFGFRDNLKPRTPGSGLRRNDEVR